LWEQRGIYLVIIMKKTTFLKCLSILTIVILVFSAAILVQNNPTRLGSAETGLVDNSAIGPTVTDKQFTANVTENNFTVVGIRASDQMGGDLTFNLYSDSSYTTVLDSSKFIGFNGFTFIAYNGKDVTGSQTNYYGYTSATDWDEIIVEMENGAVDGLIDLTFTDYYYGSFSPNEIIDTYIVTLSPDKVYDISVDSVSNEDFNLFIAGPSEFSNPDTALLKSDQDVDFEHIVGSVTEPGQYCIIVTNPGAISGSYTLNFGTLFDDTPFEILQPEATSRKYAWDVYKDSYSVIAVKAIDTTSGVFSLKSYDTSDYLVEKRAVEFTGSAGLLFMITGGLGMVQENRTEYYEISTSSWDNIVIEMENGQETSMNPLGLDSPLYTDLARLEVVDTYILNLSTANFYNISLDVPFNADLDMHLAGPTSGGRSTTIDLVAKSNQPGTGSDEFIYYKPTVSGNFSLIITKIMDQTAHYTVESKLYTGDPTDTDSDGLPDQVDKDDDEDGMPDSWEIQHGLDKLDDTDAANDNDLDNLTNIHENYGADKSPSGTDSTDPNNADTDGDGFDDEKEILALTDPLNDLDFPDATQPPEPQDLDFSYTDPVDDTRFWKVDSTTMYEVENGTGGYPDYDIISLESKETTGDTLLITLEVQGEIQDILVDEENQAEAAYYFVYFVASKFQETINITGLPVMYMPDESIGYIFAYYNLTFEGTPNTNLSRTTNSITWEVPISELDYLPETFGLYAMCWYGFTDNISKTEINVENAFDSAGLGAADVDTGGTGPGPSEPKETVELTLEGQDIKVTYSGTGSVVIKNVSDSLPDPDPAKAKGTGIFVDISPVNGTVTNLFITVTYDESDIPPNMVEEDLKLFYYDETAGHWAIAAETGVWTNNNTVWARVNHLTIFSPMAQKGSEDSPEEDDGLSMDLIMFILIIVIAIIVILGIVAAVMKSSKKRKQQQQPPPPAQYDDRRRRRDEYDEYEDDEYPEDREEGMAWDEEPEPEHPPEFKKCPKCRKRIEIPYSEGSKVSIKCKSCGAKGNISNPYLMKAKPKKDVRREKPKRPPKKETRPPKRERPERKREKPSRRKRPEPEPEPEEEDVDWGEEDVELRRLKCPKCKEKMEIPFDDESKKIIINCDTCGAKGSVRNPYL
jgi:hypothetical protein